MSEKTFLVGEDNISVSKLNVFDINRILTHRSLGNDSSPMFLDLRFMQDSSVLEIENRNFEHTGKISISCYESMRYRGWVNRRNERTSFKRGSKLWCISALYEPFDKDIHADEYGSFPFNFFYVDGLKLKFAIYSVTVEDLTGKLPEFAEFYLDLKNKYNDPRTWISHRLRMDVTCSCGHSKLIEHDALVPLLMKGFLINDIKSRLKCDICGNKGSVEILPTYSKNTPKSYKHKTALSLIEYSRNERSQAIHRNTQLEGMYGNLGGDGTDPIYLGDGSYLSPDGKILDD